MTGRGFAYSERSGTLVAMVVEALELCIEGNIVQSTSRALFEEVTFDQRNVTSIDWAGYPILDIMDAPESIEVVLINRTTCHPREPGNRRLVPRRRQSRTQFTTPPAYGCARPPSPASASGPHFLESRVTRRRQKNDVSRRCNRCSFRFSDLGLHEIAMDAVSIVGPHSSPPSARPDISRELMFLVDEGTAASAPGAVKTAKDSMR